ncbi:MAG: secondary thiamine-phosphate synthase enzyme YjbQ [Spirochaetes bacterium]|nr:secondary thiamine-phosphate synthase enzyme YjbQ [Spirochaetota bacterium]
MVYFEEISLQTVGFSDIHDLTGQISAIIKRSGVSNGLVNVFGIGSTNTITIVEYEPALVEDVKDILEKLVPSSMRSRHSETWGDDNGFSHMRATLFGCEVTAPIENGSVVLGTWQQIIVIDHDNSSRTRRVRVTVMGE